MKPAKVFHLMVRAWRDHEFEVEKEERDQMIFTTDISGLKYFDDEVFVRIIVYRNGGYHVFFTFDHLDPTAETLRLINEFNARNAFLKAAIVAKRGGNYLELHYGGLTGGKKEKAVEDDISYLLASLGTDEVLETLKPLTVITR